jgi:L-asparaginase / beta-aspartyl-peptidase
MKPFKWLLLFLIPVLLTAFMPGDKGSRSPGHHDFVPPKWVLVIHGGAGRINPQRLNPEEQKAYESSLQRALEIGKSMLSKGSTALDVVEAVIRYLEDDSLFNAGKGAVLNAAGLPELDASIMDGNSRKAGAVAGVSHIRNPISTARLVMEHSVHVLLAGKGAEDFARSQKAEMVDPQYFITFKAREDYLRAASALDKSGTVGAVALDIYNNLAAGTSTGGMLMKRHGRIGDSPIIGAGTYADNSTCAVSCTGHGEYFIRNAVAFDMHARMKYLGVPVQAAADSIIHGVLKRSGGSGGLIALDRQGNYSMCFNTEGMFRGVVSADHPAKVMMFATEE